jgi:light-independent protochlorophyllide reductase subunit B
MQLTLWTYEGPPHIGAMRIATALQDVHYVLHAPQGDTYADLLFTMIERLPRRPPVTYTTFQARDLGGDTAQLFKDAVAQANARFAPKAILVGASCTAELIQDDPGGLAQALALDIPVVPLELPAYQRKENWGAAETLYQLVRRVAQKSDGHNSNTPNEYIRPRCNILGPTALGFRHRDDVKEISGLLHALGVEVSVVAPLNATVAELQRLPEADFNVVLYPEIANTTALWLERTFDQPFTKTIPIGVGATREFIREVAALAKIDVPAHIEQRNQSVWYARSVDSTYLTGKRVYVFGDATHVVAAARYASQEMGFEVVGMGTYSREFAREVREAAKNYGVEALITDDYLAVEAQIEALHPELILGTQMERHIAKRHGVPCAVISSPVHVQDFPARYAPQMGFEGANVLFDTWVHPLMMGLEEHLLGMFREDFEFNDQAAPSHLGAVRTQNATLHDNAIDSVVQAPQSAPHTASHTVKNATTHASTPSATVTSAEAAKHVANASLAAGGSMWSMDAEKELGKIPFFVRGKARRNTEKFALEQGLSTITVETLYDAKAHFSR